MSGLPRILLVNCFNDEREMYVEYLQFAGFDALHECDPDAALAMAVTQRPDVVITDILLPGHPDGLELIRRLRGNPRTARASVIVLTGLVTPEYRAHAARAGCDMFLVKPCLPETLAFEIRAAVAGQDRGDIQQA
jgi:DNA-binding response OmpR family regulator